MQLFLWSTIVLATAIQFGVAECKSHHKKGSHHSHHHHKNRKHHSEERHFFRGSLADFTSSDYNSDRHVKPRGEKFKDNYDNNYHHSQEESYAFEYNYGEKNLHPKTDFDFRNTGDFPDHRTVADDNDGRYKDLAQFYLPSEVSSDDQQSRPQTNILKSNRRKNGGPVDRMNMKKYKRKTKNHRKKVFKVDDGVSDYSESHLKRSNELNGLIVITPKIRDNHENDIFMKSATDIDQELLHILETENDKLEFMKSLKSHTSLMQRDYPDKSTNNIKKHKIKSKQIFSPNSLTKKQVSSKNGSNLRARPLDTENQKHKSANPSRWTLTYHGPGSAESSLNNSLVNVTAQVGGDTFLPCKVGHLGDRQISWIRSRDWHVLSSGNTLFTPDSRVSVLHEPGTQDWTLHIRYVTPRDNGTYECQVSTGTGIISIFVNLTVVTPIARIPGRGNYHVNKGSPIVLNCLITRSPVAPRYVFWYQNGKQLNFLRNKPEIRISLEKVDTNDENFAAGISAISRLRIGSANDSNSGNYTCDAPMTLPASTTVFVTEGDKTAAVQRIDSSGSRSSSLTQFSFVSLVINQWVLVVISKYYFNNNFILFTFNS